MIYFFKKIKGKESLNLRFWGRGCIRNQRKEAKRDLKPMKENSN